MNRARKLLQKSLAGAGAIGVAMLTCGSANAATTTASGVTAVLDGDVLRVFGNDLDNNVTISRDAAGTILVNGGAIPVTGGTPTVANTAQIATVGRDGNDTLTLNEANGALPTVVHFGGAGNDNLTGGSSGDLLFGQRGDDTLNGVGGFDLMFASAGEDTLTGGDADDQAFGGPGNDRMIWNPGDDTDLNEGGAGDDTVEVNGGSGAEIFTTTANGTRVRFDRLDPAPFAIDIGTSENLVLNANGGNDSFSSTGNLAALIKLTVDGGADDDTLLGGNGVDLILGGIGNDFVDGQQGNDVAFLGAGDDTFQWDPGDGSDVVEGQDGRDDLLFNGSSADERFAATANGGRVLFTRDLANILMDLDDVEVIDLHALGGRDLLTVNDLSGTDVTEVISDLAANGGATDGQSDNVVVNGTNGDDVAVVVGDAAGTSVQGLAAQLSITGGSPAEGDRLTVNALAGDDVVDGSAMSAAAVLLTEDGGEGDDVLLGGAGNDLLLGGANDDVLLGGGGLDVIDGGDGDDIEIQTIANDTVRSARPANDTWLAQHVRVVSGQTVLDLGDKEIKPAEADLSPLLPAES